MSVLSRFGAFEPSGRYCLAARFVRNQHVAAAIMALTLGAVGPAPAQAAGAQNEARPPGTATPVSTEPTKPTDFNADGSMPDAIVKAGVETRALRAWDCDQPNNAPVVWARADHGTISIKPITSGPRCGRLSMSMAGIFYTSEPGFKGTDTVHILGFLSNGSRIDQTATLLVK